MKTQSRVITFGTDRGFDYSAGEISYDSLARPTFDFYIRGEKRDTLSLGVSGEHNVYNALAAAAAALRQALPGGGEAGTSELYGNQAPLREKGSPEWGDDYRRLRPPSPGDSVEP